MITNTTRPTAKAGTKRRTTQSHTLRDCPMGIDVVIDGIDLDDHHRFRLMELGLRAGTTLRVVQHGNFGGRVVARGPERIALDGGTARSIIVHIDSTTEGSGAR